MAAARRRRQRPDQDPLLGDAMWSIYFHSMYRRSSTGSALRVDDPESRFHSPDLAAMPLQSAIGVLLDSSGDHIRARRAIGFKKLVSAGFQLRGHPDFDRDQGPLEAEATKLITHRMAELSGVLGIDWDELIALSLDSLAEALGFVTRKIDEQASLIGGCTVKDPSCIACHNGLTLETVVKGEVRVKNRTIEQLARIVDPRAWTECNPYFLESVRVHDDLPNNYPEHPDHTKPLGVSWAGTLREQVKAKPVIVTTILDIDFQVGTSSVHLEYDLNDSIKMEFAGIEKSDPIIIDKGHTIVKPDPQDPAWHQIEFTKTVKFKDVTPGDDDDVDYGEMLNYWLPGILCLWVEDKVNVGPCCEPEWFE